MMSHHQSLSPHGRGVWGEGMCQIDSQTPVYREDLKFSQNKPLEVRYYPAAFVTFTAVLKPDLGLGV